MMAPLSDARRGNKDYHEVTITHTKKTNSKISFKVAIYVQVNLQVLWPFLDFHLLKINFNQN